MENEIKQKKSKKMRNLQLSKRIIIISASLHVRCQGYQNGLFCLSHFIEKKIFTLCENFPHLVL